MRTRPTSLPVDAELSAGQRSSASRGIANVLPGLAALAAGATGCERLFHGRHLLGRLDWLQVVGNLASGLKVHHRPARDDQGAPRCRCAIDLPYGTWENLAPS